MKILWLGFRILVILLLLCLIGFQIHSLANPINQSPLTVRLEAEEADTELQYVLVGNRLDNFRKKADKFFDKSLKSAFDKKYESVIFTVNSDKIVVHAVPVDRYPPKADETAVIKKDNKDFEVLQQELANLGK